MRRACGCYCGDGFDCVVQTCHCDDLPSLENSVVTPWDGYGLAFVAPGSQSGVDEVSVEVRAADANEGGCR